MAFTLLAAAGCGGSDAPRPPGVPVNVQASAGDGAATVRWDAVAGADSYVVYWSIASGVTKASGTAIPATDVTVTHSGLANGTTYHYVVTAANSGGEGAESAEVSATPVPAYYPLAIGKAGSGAGTVVSSPAAVDCGLTCTASIPTGTDVTLSATPDATSTFDGWSGDCSGTAPCTVSMTAAHSVGATFTRITYDLAVARAGTGGGTVASSPAGIDCGLTCSATFDAAAVVTLTATADGTSTFAGWTGDCAGTSPTCDVTVDAARSVGATFTRITHAIAIAKTGTGAGTVSSSPAGIACDTACSNASHAYDAATVVTLTATPDATSTFAGWTGDCAGTSPTCDVTVDAARSVGATFTRITHAIAIAKTGTGAGSVSSSPAGIACDTACSNASHAYDAATVVTLTATPDATSTFAGWSGACSGTSPTCAVTMDGAKSVGAAFARITYALGVTIGTGGGTVTSSPAGISCGSTCSATYDAATVVTLTAAPDATSTFAGWTGACTGTSPTCAVTMDAAKSVGATFRYELSASTAGTGGGAVASAPAGLSCGATCSATFEAATVVTLTATPDSTSTFDGWSGACAGASATCAVVMDQARSVTATFTRITYGLTVTRSGTGAGAISSVPSGISCGSTCSATYDAATAVTLTATPDATSNFTGWTGACTGTSTTCIVTMDGAKSVTATFTRITYGLTVTRSGTGAGAVTSVPSGISCGSTCSATFEAATVVTLTATPDSTSTFDGWSGACAGTSATCTVTMDAAKSVTATITRITYGLTVAKSGTGGGVVTSSPAGISCGSTCSATYDAATVVTLAATPDATSDFTGWSGACTGTSTTCIVTMDGAKSVDAAFTRRTHVLTVSVAGSGRVTSSPAGIDCVTGTCPAAYAEGTVVTLVANAYAGFFGWTGACSGTGTCVVTMDAAKTVGAIFGYSLLVNKAGTGAGTVTSSPAGIVCGPTCGSASTNFPAGTVVTLTATPDGSSAFGGWAGICTPAGTSGTCVFTLRNSYFATATFTP